MWRLHRWRVRARWWRACNRQVSLTVRMTVLCMRHAPLLAACSAVDLQSRRASQHLVHTNRIKKSQAYFIAPSPPNCMFPRARARVAKHLPARPAKPQRQIWSSVIARIGSTSDTTTVGTRATKAESPRPLGWQGIVEQSPASPFVFASFASNVMLRLLGRAAGPCTALVEIATSGSLANPVRCLASVGRLPGQLYVAPGAASSSGSGLNEPGSCQLKGISAHAARSWRQARTFLGALSTPTSKTYTERKLIA